MSGSGGGGQDNKIIRPGGPKTIERDAGSKTIVDSIGTAGTGRNAGEREDAEGEEGGRGKKASERVHLRWLLVL